MNDPASTDSLADMTPQRAAAEDTASPGSDHLFAQQIAAGDVRAWERFFDLYFPWTYRFAYRHLGGNHADAEDLCSDILTTAARSVKHFDSKRGTLDLWLLGLARHRLARFCRRRRRELPLIPEADTSAPNPDIPLVSQPAHAAHTRDLVNRVLASLPQRQAAVLVGKYVSGHTVDELARSMHSSPKAVESLLSRARAAFRSAFRSLLHDDSGGEDDA